MRNFSLTFLLIMFLPIQLLAEPAPLTTSSIAVPITCLMLGFRKDFWTFAGLVTVFSCCVSAAFGCFSEAELFPFISLVSFILPLSGFFFSLALSERPDLERRFLGGFWVPGAIFAVVLVVNLVINNGVARGAIAAQNLEFGEYSASAANCDFFVVNTFATFGVNSFAGICLAFVFLLCVSLAYQPSRFKRFVIILSIVSLGTFGALLHSRSFFIGLIVFAGCYVVVLRGSAFVRLLISFALVIFIAAVVLKDERVINSFESLGSKNLDDISSSRVSLLQEFNRGSNIFFGSKFGPLFHENDSNNSYHMYFLTVLAKGGVIILSLFLLLLLGPLFFRFYLNRQVTGVRPAVVDAILIAGNASFLIQSLFWDIYAVQLYGLIAWMFAGMVCGSTNLVGKVDLN